MGKIKVFLYNPWVLKIGGGLILFVLTTAITSMLKSISLSGSILFLINVIISFLISEVKIWIFLVIVTVIILSLQIITKINKRTSPEWTNYNKDLIHNCLYRWSYGYESDNFYIIGLQQLCANCSCDLSIGTTKSDYLGYRDNYLYCPKCKSQFGIYIEKDEDIKKIIRHNISSEDYKKSSFYTKD